MSDIESLETGDMPEPGLEEEPRLKVSLDQSEPSQTDVDWAKEHINEDPDNRDQVISDLRDMIFERGECSPHRTDDKFLLRFLRARHFVVRKAHRLMVNYYDFKETSPEFFENVDVSRMRELAKTMIMSVPPYRDQQGRRMMILRIGNWDPSEFTVTELFQLAIGILELAMMESVTQIKGCILLVDLSDLTFNMAWYMTPTLARNFIKLAITSFPIRIEAAHFIHTSWVFDTAWNMFKPLINDAVKDRIYFHGEDLDSLHSFVAPKYLPKRYGGMHLEYPLDIWFEDVLKNNDTLIDELVKMGYDDMQQLKGCKD